MQNLWVAWYAHAALIQITLPRLFAALVLGAIIGAERQWRQRAAGMRTNTLVCFGAAAFVDLGTTVGGPSTTNIIAYVVSGVGFLGAGAIMKEGGSIRGLNTAATLWCSAAVGACAGAGKLLDAISVTILLVGINLTLRPLSRWIDLRSAMLSRAGHHYRFMIVCQREDEQAVSSLLVRALASRPLTLRSLRIEQADDRDETAVEAVIEANQRNTIMLEELLAELKADPKVIEALWAESTGEVHDGT